MAGPDEAIKKLYKVFTTFFSMKDLGNEFQEAVRIEVFGCSESATDFSEMLYPKSENTINSLEDGEGYEKIEKSSVSVIFPYPDKTDNESLSSIICRIAPHNRKKIIFCIPEQTDAGKKITVDSLLESMSMEKALWFKTQEQITKNILSKMGRKSFPAARCYPGLRETLTAQQIGLIARENSYIAFISSIPASIPVVGTIASLFAVAGETLILTANQVRLCMRISGIYGYKLDFFARMSELWPILAGGLGWKTLAKAAVGFLPGAGPFIKASIAYAGTVVAGTGAKMFYRDGKIMTSEEIRRIYAKGKKAFSEKASQILNKKNKEG